eukprot:10700117-Lingulodinium_polyedra.AAC.1
MQRVMGVAMDHICRIAQQPNGHLQIDKSGCWRMQSISAILGSEDRPLWLCMVSEGGRVECSDAALRTFGACRVQM